MKKTLTILLFFALFSHVWAQERKLSGKVTDENGEGLPGVNVLLKGTKIGSVTDIEGNYQIVVSGESNTIVFSFIGYQTGEVEIGSFSVLNHVMKEDVTSLSEVVVTALGIEREKEALGFSVTELEGKGFTQARETNVANGLAGKVAGVNVSNIASGPAGSSRVIIRGNTSLTQNNQPLYIVDGVPIDNSNLGAAGQWGGRDQGDGIGSINPDDIETMTVLKGNTAAALYGFRASNGVILITTKSGKSKKGLNLEINSNYVFDKAINRLDIQKEYGHGSKGQKPKTLEEALGAGDIAWGGKLDGSSVIQFDGVERPYAYAGDNFDKFYQTGHTFTNTIALSGGSEDMGFRFSASKLDNEGIIPGNKYKRNNFSLNANGKVGKKLTFNASGSYIVQETKNPPAQGDLVSNVNYTVWSLAPSINVEDLKGDPNRLGANPDGTELLPATTIWFENPYYSAYQKKNESERNRVLGSFSLQYDFTEWLYVKGRIGVDHWDRRNMDLRPYGSAQSPLGYINQSQTKHNEINNDIMLGSQQEFSSGFGYNVLIGASSMRQNRYSNSTNGRDFAIADFPHYSNTTNRTGGTSLWELGTNSVYGLTEVSYKSYLYLTATGRQDWFSTLNGKGIFYPSASMSAVISEMVKMPTSFTYLKLRTAWAQVGGATNPYALNQTYSLGQPHYGVAQGGVAQSVVANAQLKPLTATEFEIGFDARFLDNRVGIDFAVYSRKTEDDILDASISTTSGYNAAKVNVGKVTNKGVELLFTATPILKSKFSWDISLNMSHNKSEVVSLLDPEVADERLFVDQNRAQTANVEHIEGLPYGQVTGWIYLRDAAGNIVHNDAGLPMRDEEAGLVPFGAGVHPFFGGITNSFNFGPINMSFLIDYKSGAVIFSGTNSWLYRRGIHKNTLVGREEGIGVLPGSEMSTYYNEIRNKIAEQFIYDADFAKLRELTIGYNLPKSILDKLKIASARFSIVGRNLLLLHSNVENIDPESTYNEGNAQGMDYFQTPQSRSYGFNLNLKF
ncbi:SusC/RagA family TonB-linked outer membrane protein [Flexithrix dorotheae]|uniref:SusC/RagA family TonB-linked outer membrane protein n=1 Tax=Flexithrix dorotheae TaxID=70993 RepID=UPI00037522D0|nr:SusC/RagA family TonB-linked outer membrane protein [Flexithrix dorotheae]